MQNIQLTDVELDAVDYVLNNDDPNGSEVVSGNTVTPLARLTNDEFISSMKDLLGLRDRSANIESVLSSLPPESDVAGLASDSSVQTINQSTISGLSTSAMAAAEDFLALSNDSPEDAMDCASFGNLENVAEGKSASQSSRYRSSTDAELAVDGDTNGDFYAGSVMHTKSGEQEWWQVDLGNNQRISHIELFNRINCCSERLTDFYILVSENSFNSNASLDDLLNDPNVTSIHHATDVQASKTIDINTRGRYLRVQLASSETPLAMAEVQVFAESDRVYDYDDCLEDFGSDLLARALVRDLSNEETSGIRTLIETVNDNLFGVVFSDSDEARRLKLGAMISYVFVHPEFLFLAEEGDGNTGQVNGNETSSLTSEEIARRLSYFLTGSTPDELLSADAKAGKLTDPFVREDHIDRLLNSSKVEEYYFKLVSGWIGIDEAKSTPEDVQNLNEYILNWISNEQSFAQFYTGSFNVKLTNNSTSSMPVGILGAKAFVESHTSFPTGGFINRGKFVTSRLLCADLPDDIPAEAFEENADDTVALFHNLADQPCATCHKVFDNYGAQFQEFDDETSLFTANDSLYGDSFTLFEIGDIFGELDGTVTSLANTVANSDTAASCMSELLFRNAFRRSVNESENFDIALIDTYVSEWFNSDTSSLKSLLKTIATSDSFVMIYK